MDYYDKRTIGRYAPRVQDVDDAPRYRRAEEDPMFLFFDGKSFTSHSVTRPGKADFYTGGMGVTAAMLRPGRLGHTDWDYGRAYVLCEYAFRCIEMVASDIAAIKHGVRNKQTKADWPDHPLMKALTWAKWVCYQDIINLWQKALFIWGENYLLPIENGFRNPDTGRPFYSGIQWLNPLATEPVVTYNYLEGFEYTAYGMQRYRPDQIIFDKVGSVFDDLRGQSRVSVALMAENIDIEIKRYTLDRFIKDMRFSGILTGRQGSQIGQAELDGAVEKLKQQKNSRLVALAAALEFQKVENDFSDKHYAASDDARRRITTALGVPMSVVGAWDDANYQSAPAQLGFYYDHVVFREADRLTEFINQIVMPYFDPWGTAEWYYDKDSVMTLIEDKAAKTTMVNGRVQAGTLTINEGRAALGDKPLPNGDVLMIPSGMILVQPEKLLEFAERQAQQIAASPTGTPMFAPMAIDAVTPQQPALPAPTGGKSICLMLSLANNPDLIDLQQKVQKLYADTPMQWNKPEEFHVTLIYAPSVTDEQITSLVEALDDVDVPEFSLNIGSLRTFQNPGEYAVVFFVRRNTSLYDYQEMLHEMFTQLGVSMSSYSTPDQYQPHVTMGFSSTQVKGATYKTKLRVKPTKLLLMAGDEVLYERSPGEEVESPADEEEAPEPELPDPLDELKTWRKKALNAGAAKAVGFVCYAVPEGVADFVRDGLTDDVDKAGIKSLFDQAEDALKASGDDLPVDENKFVELAQVWESLGIDLIGQVNDGNSDESQS